MQTRRGFLLGLTKLTIGISAARLLPLDNLTFVSPPVELEAAHRIHDFATLLNEYLPQKMLIEEMMQPNWLLKRFDSGEWNGNVIPISFEMSR